MPRKIVIRTRDKVILAVVIGVTLAALLVAGCYIAAGY